MSLERGRCLFSLVILTGFLLGTAHGQNSTTTTTPMTTTSMTTTPMTTTAPTTDTVLTTTISPTTPVEVTNTTVITGSVMTTESVMISSETTTADLSTGNNDTVEVTGPTEVMTEIVTEIVNSSTTMITSSLATMNVTIPTVDPCAEIACENGGTCNANNGTCICTNGWDGDNCSEDVDECRFASSCDETYVCVNSQGSYNCTCQKGYQPQNGSSTSCVDVDECMDEDNPCDATNGQCTNTDGSYICTCNPGYALNRTDNSSCYEINECDDNPCKNGGTCTDLVNEYNCTCLEGFSGTICENDIDACNPDPCENGNCTNHPMYPNDANYTCECFTGWMGRNCSDDVRECDDNPCSNNGTCYELDGSYNCTCTPGFNGTNCEITCPDDTYGAYCVGMCTCVVRANCSRSDGTCSCDPAFDGAVCDKEELAVTASLISPDNTISERDYFTLACEVNLAKTDLEEVAWNRSGVRLPNETDLDYIVDTAPELGMYNITIRSASAEHTGNYTCTAVTAGNQLSVSSEVIVISVLVVGGIVDGPKDDRVGLNDTARLNCTAFSSQSVTLAWERNGQRLSTVNRTTVTNKTGPKTPGGTNYSIILEVMDIIRADNGIYQCIVFDQAGNETDRGNFSISVVEVPDLSNPRYLYNDVATQLTIAWDEYNVNAVTTTCTAFYNASGSNMTQEMSFENPKKQANITDLTPYTTYSVSLICQNEVGFSEQLIYTDNTTFQGAPDPPTDIAVSDVQKTSAVVTWKPPETINGVLDGYTIEVFCSDPCEPYLKDLGSNINRHPLENLSPGTDYVVKVKAFTTEERLTGDFKKRRGEAAEKNFSTNPDIPTSPLGIAVSDTPELCEITWEEPSPTNGDITSYTLTMNTSRLGDDTLLATETMSDITDMRWSKSKSELPFYSDFRIHVTATNAAGEGPPSEVVRCRRNDIGAPEEPEKLPSPSAKSHFSFTTTFPDYNDRNGPVSCYEVVVVQLEDANAVPDPDDVIYSPEQVKEYKDRGIGVPYIAKVMNSVPSGNEITIGTEDEELSTCQTGGSSRRRRSTVAAGEITGVNGPLNPNGIYTSFVRVYSPTGEDQVYYENGPFMTAVVLEGRPPNVGAIVGAIFGVAIIICLVAVILLMYRRRRDYPGDPLMTPTSNGPRENGNGTVIGMENLGIEDELVVKPIKLENLEKAIREKAKDEKRIFWEEYKALPNRPPPMVTMNSSNLPANRDKNRYINIIAYDHTRVKLKHMDGIEGSDYINASYVNGYQSPDKFIAAQGKFRMPYLGILNLCAEFTKEQWEDCRSLNEIGPKDNTLEDFWRMIWECNCSTIVMLTKCVEDGKDKCSQYWPNTGSVKYGRFEVKLDQVKETAEYVIRSFFVSEHGKESGQRSITQFHFLGWPDHGQPDYPSPMLCLIKRVRHLTSKMNHRANIVVHCSAGVGRTGTYIVIDAMLDMIKHEKQVDIYNFIHEIRQQRNTLVQSFVQYFFIHIALLEEHLFGHMDVAMSDFPAYYQQLSNKSDYNEDLTKLEEEFRRACKLGVNGTEQTYANIDQNKDKNRIGHILPFDKNIVKLERLIGEEFSDYINASYITGYDRKNMYIATQGPLPNTVADFWRMVWESQTSTIVMLTETNEKGHEMCAQYWPLEVDEVEEHGDISVTLVEESDEDEAFTVRDVEISHAQVTQNIYGNVDNEGEGSGEAADSPEGESSYGNIPESPPPTPMKDIRKIRQFHFRGWPEVGVPDTGIDLMRLVNKSHLHQKERGAHPIVVHCSAGAGRTGVFIALNVLMSRMEEESMIDVFQTVRGLRQQRPHMVQDLAQYKFCYLAMVEYIQDQSTEYQNYVPRV